MDEIDRINLLIRIFDLQIKEIGAKAGIERSRMTKVLKKDLRMSSSELVGIANQFPEYKHWIIFNKAIPFLLKCKPIRLEINHLLNTRATAKRGPPRT